MKYIRYINDIHLDGDNSWIPNTMEGDSETLLIIAGDLWTDSRHLTKALPEFFGKVWMTKIASMFKYVLYVQGNHDYWNANLSTLTEKNRTLAQELKLDNVFLLENSSIVLNGITFVGGTLWTDYDNRDAISILSASSMMNDYRLTRVGKDFKRLDPSDCLQVFDSTKKTIFDTARNCKGSNLPCIVVTHMAPSYSSVNEKYRNSRDRLANTWYYSDLDKEILDSGIKYWFHGHMHNAVEYTIGDTTVMCNPLGYIGEHLTGFKDYARIDVSLLKT